MSALGTVIAIMASAFLVGGLARFAVPGPDPMPAWLTITIGLIGSAVGAGIGALASARDPYAVELGAFFTAIALVIGYRKLVQKRPIYGPEALRFPRRGIGVQEYRARLARVGVDPDAPLDRALGERRRREAPPREHDVQADESRKTPPEQEDTPDSDS